MVEDILTNECSKMLQKKGFLTDIGSKTDEKLTIFHKNVLPAYFSPPPKVGGGRFLPKYFPLKECEASLNNYAAEQLNQDILGRMIKQFCFAHFQVKV